MTIVAVDLGKSFFGGTDQMQGISRSTRSAGRQCGQPRAAHFDQCPGDRQEKPETSGFIKDELSADSVCLVHRQIPLTHVPLDAGPKLDSPMQCAGSTGMRLSESQYLSGAWFGDESSLARSAWKQKKSGPVPEGRLI
jgi:hypothetical protein